MSKVGGVSVSGASPRLAVLQCLLDRGDESLADLLEKAQGRWPPPGEALRCLVPDYSQLVYKERNPEQGIPVEFVKVDVKPESLIREHLKAKHGKLTPVCEQKWCAKCSACPGLT